MSVIKYMFSDTAVLVKDCSECLFLKDTKTRKICVRRTCHLGSLGATLLAMFPNMVFQLVNELCCMKYC